MNTPDLSKLKIDRSAPARPAGNRRKLWIVGAAAAIVAVVLFMLMPRSVPVQSATVVTRYPSQQIAVLNASGYVVAQRKAAVATKATGRLEWLGVEEGSRVKAGDLLARIDARDVEAQRDAAIANHASARAALSSVQAEARNAAAELQRTRDLAARNFISSSAVDSAVARDEQARAAVANAQGALAAAAANERNARVSVDFTEIRAPFDGVVLTKSANVGDVVTPFSSAADSKGAVVSMADMSTLEVEADVSESSLSKIAVGQPCEILLDALPQDRFTGTVSRMVPTVDRSKATVTTKIRFDKLDDRILPDMSAKVSFLSRKIAVGEQKPMLAVAPTALTERGGKTVVFRILTKDGETTVAEVPVTTGVRTEDFVEVSGALKSGDKIVAQPPASLRDGTTVVVETK